MATHYIATPKNGRVGKARQLAAKRLVVRAGTHNLSIVGKAILNAWKPQINTHLAWVKWETPAGGTEFIASVFIPGTVKPIATILVEEMEQD